MATVRNNVSSEMMLAVRNRNVDKFRSCLAQGFDVRTFVRSTNASWMPFVEKVARSDFIDGLRILLVETKPCPISRDDAVRAFQAIVRSGASSAAISVFLETTVRGNLRIMVPAKVYYHAMRCQEWTFAQMIVEQPDFDVECCLIDGPLIFDIWELPLHCAVRHNRVDIVTRLLEKGAAVDGTNSDGITPLMFACGSVSFESVKVLLSYGADPNYTNTKKIGAWPYGSLAHLHVPTYPDFHSDLMQWKMTDNAERILCMMVANGWIPSPDHWLIHTKVIGDTCISWVGGEYVKDLVHRKPHLAELAIDQSRQHLRNWAGRKRGADFNETLDELYLPWVVKRQLRLDFNY